MCVVQDCDRDARVSQVVAQVLRHVSRRPVGMVTACCFAALRLQPVGDDIRLFGLVDGCARDFEVLEFASDLLRAVCLALLFIAFLPGKIFVLLTAFEQYQTYERVR
jgi:hypothetical protein